MKADQLLAEYIGIFNDLPIGLYRTGLDGTFLKANKECMALLGFDSMDELLTAKASDFYLKSEDRLKFIDALEETGVLKNYELALKNKHGKKFWVAITARLHKDLGFLEGSLMDISERKRLEEELDRYRMSEAACLQDLTKEARKRISEISLNGHAHAEATSPGPCLQ